MMAPLVLMLSTLVAGAVEYAELTQVTGTVLWEGKRVQKGLRITEAGTLEATVDGKAQLKYLTDGTLMNVTEGSSLKVSAPGAQLVAEIPKGIVRILAEGRKGPRPPIKIITRSATLGVRGTDFMAVSNPILQESEIIVFNGDVEFTSSVGKGDSKGIRTGQWGGVGGRFGQRIADIISLPKAALEHYSRITSVD